METQIWAANNDAIAWFKSYYVVWKPEEIEADEDEEQKFKSYYVVWKHPSLRLRNIHIARLNRTM